MMEDFLSFGHQHQRSPHQNAGSPERRLGIAVNKRLGLPGLTPSGTVTALFAGTVGVTGLPRQQCGLGEEVSFGSGPQISPSIYWNCQRRTSAGIATSFFALGFWNNASGKPEKHRHHLGLPKSLNITTFRAAGTSLPGSLDIFISFRTAPEYHVWSR